MNDRLDDINAEVTDDLLRQIQDLQDENRKMAEQVDAMKNENAQARLWAQQCFQFCPMCGRKMSETEDPHD